MMTTNSRLAQVFLALAVVAGVQQGRVVDAWWFFAGPQVTAVAKFDLAGVSGFIKFSQLVADGPTQVDYDLQGLKGNNQFYHVHLRPVPKYDATQVNYNATKLAELCSEQSVGSHLNPFKVTAKLPPQSAPFDQYETGDLSGKHGAFKLASGELDHYIGSYSDDKLPMSGENSIVGRSVVIHYNDGKRWVCASIEPAAV